MKKFSDLFLAFIFIALFSFPMLIIGILIKLTSKGPIFYHSRRIGKNNRIFIMPKFRTLKINTPQLASHLLANSDSHMVPMAGFLRKSSLDELPQLFSVLRGDMSFVGPRPALYNQYDLIKLRSEKNIHKLTPGITGWAQINGRDNISIKEKVNLDYEYLLKKNFFFDLYILMMSSIKVFKNKDISH